MDHVTRGFLAICAYHAICGCGGTDVHFGLLLPYTGSWPVGQSISGAALVAVEDANTILAPWNRTLRFIWHDTKCHKSNGLKEVVDLYFKLRPDFHAYIGGGCDVVCEPGGLLAAAWSIPMVSWGCSSTDLSNKDDYPTFARLVGPHHKMTGMFARLFDEFNWHAVGIMASSEVVWQLAAHAIKLDLQYRGTEVREFHSFDPGHVNIVGKEKQLIVDIIKDLRRKVRSEYSLF